ncbi:MAG: NTP transferase domain-containing protein [Anaerolineales bacterium]|nr:NTP transferase domain-containing protein [Anaerolineales bacterium]
MNEPNTAVILAAGASTRTHPLTIDRPKPMLPVLNKPLLQHILNQLEGLVDLAVLVVGFERQQIQTYFGEKYKSIRLEYCIQHQQLGTGHALMQAKPWLGDAFFVLNGDDLVHHNDLERMAKYAFAVLGAVVPDPRPFGILQIQNGYLERIIEKPSTFVGQPLVNTGVFVFRKEIFSGLEAINRSVRGEYELVEAIQHLPAGIKVKAIPITEYWRPIGHPWKLLETNRFLLDREKLETTLFEGVTQIGPVLIGQGTKIEPNAILGPGVSVGSNCVIEFGAKLENCLVMNNVHIGSNCELSESILGEGVVVGANCHTVIRPIQVDTVQLVIKGKLVDTGRNSLGAIIGSGARIGANCRLSAGVRLWPNCLVPENTFLQDDMLGV